MKSLLRDIRDCQICKEFLPLGPNPVIAASDLSKIAVIGQAPGRKVHSTGIPWDDQSGDRLRSWMGVTKEVFYDDKSIALIPMGFCYPGTGKSGDLPPRPECVEKWHGLLLGRMKPDLVILAGQYAQKEYLGRLRKKTLTLTVASFEKYLPEYFVLPHPSPRNNIWLKKNPWFEAEVIPRLRARIKGCLN